MSIFGVFGVVALASSLPSNDFIKLLERVAGSSAEKCGVVRQGEDAASALKCAQLSLSSGRSFWIAIEHSGVDSFIWIGAAQEVDGSTWVVRLDTDSTGGSSRPKPIMEIKPCRKVEISPNNAMSSILCRDPWK